VAAAGPPFIVQVRLFMFRRRFVTANNLSKSGWRWGCVSAIDSNGQTIWIVDAHRGDGKRFVVHADEKLTAFREFGIGGSRALPLSLFCDGLESRLRE
jgi:hypothetical protein